jgi:RHS repeat-associated protein
VTAYAYDANGNLTRVVQGSAAMGGGFATASNFDRLQRLRNITDPLGGELSMEYNGRDQVTAIVDPRRLRTAYQRDGFGQTIRLSSPDTGASSQQFDSAGNLVMRTDARGVTEFRSHDALHRLTSLVYKSAGQADLVMAWRYDEAVAGSTFGKGRLTSTAYPGGGSRLGYDAWGRLISVIQTAQTATGTAARLQTQWQYDGAGNVVQLVYPSGRVVNVAHAAGKPLSVSLMGGLGGVERLLISGIQHEPFGAVRSWNWHHDAGVQRHERQFDTAGRMVRHTLGRLTRDLRYDAADRLVGVNHCCNASLAQGTSAFMLDQTFAYDNLGRLVSAAGVSGNWTYRYDANGNRTGTSVNGALRAWFPAKDSNRLLAAADPTRTFEHDASGNTAADWQNGSGWVAGHDLAGRLAVLTRTTPSVGAVGKTVQLSYTYNGQGQRVVRHRATSTACVPGASLCNGSAQPPEAVVFVYGQQGELLGEYRAADGAMLREYVWLGQIPVAVIAPQAILPGATTDIFHIHADHLNTPRLVLDTAGRRRWTWLSGEPFGATAANDNPEGFGAFTFNLRFPGQYFDQDSGLVYNHYRDFDPSLGRYTQSDPIGLAGGINTYAYVENQPTMMTDPLGLEPRNTGRPAVLVCVYRQGGQDFTCIDESSGITVVAGSCYSGTGAGRNNPDMNGVPSVGPTPRGWWGIGVPQDIRLGRPSFRLTPDPDNSVFQTRRQPQSFLIHADNTANDASEGCTICEKRIRDIIARYPGSRMVVQ